MSFGFGLGDFLATGELAWRLYRDCILIARGAPQEFRLLVEELKTLNAMMRSFHEELNEPRSVLARAGEERHKLIAEILKRINETLDRLTELFDKHRYIGSTARQGVKRTWDKFKWALDAKDVDGLRSKLSYHNGVLGLLLVCAGNSSLQRIENTTKSIDDGLHQLNTYLRRAQTTGTLQPIAPIATASALDNSARVAFSEQCMKAAEVSQRWLAIGIDEWIRAGRWWLLKAHFELQRPGVDPDSAIVSPEAYLDLLKASWILTDVIAVHPQFGLIESKVQYEVMELTQAINQEFQRMVDMNLKLPELLGLNDIVIWEGHNQSPTPRLSPQVKGEREWVMSSEMIIHQSFGNYQPHDHTTTVIVCITVVLHTAEQARLTFHDQSWRCLVNLDLASVPSLRTSGSGVIIQGSEVIIEGHKVILGSAGDAVLLHAILNLYTRCRFLLEGLPLDRILPYHHAFTLLIALKIHTYVYPYNPMILQYLSNLRQYQPSTCGVCALLDGAITILKGFTFKGFASGVVKPLSNASEKTEKLQMYFTESVFGWVLSTGHYDVALQWLQFQRVKHNFDTCSLENWINIAVDTITATDKDYYFVKLWLDSGLDPYGNQASGLSLFYDAVCRAHEPTIRLLLERGADADGSPIHRSRPLHWAARHGHEGVVKLLLDRDANVNPRDPRGWTPLHQAAKNGDRKIVGLLLGRDANVNCRDDDSDETPLHFAVCGGHLEIVRLLLDKDASFDCSNCFGEVPLHRAAGTGHVEIVELLLDRGADVNCAAQLHRHPPLYEAASQGHVEIVKLLLDRNADVDCVQHQHRSWIPLQVAIHQGHVDIVKPLLDRGANVEIVGSGGRKPLHEAVFTRNSEIISLLLDRGADIDSLNGVDNTPLSVAADLGHEEIVKLLLDRGASIDHRGQSGYTPLFSATISMHLGTVKLLLDHGANPYLELMYGSTLMSAVRVADVLKFPEIIQCFVEHEANGETK